MPKLLEGPIPGQSLTQPKGSMPMEQPPRFVSPEEALDFIWEKLSRKEQLATILMLLKQGIPAQAIASTILYAWGLKGMWAPDLMLLIARTVAYQIAALGEVNGVKKVTIKSPNKQATERLARLAKATAPDMVEAPAAEVKGVITLGGGA